MRKAHLSVDVSRYYLRHNFPISEAFVPAVVFPSLLFVALPCFAVKSYKANSNTNCSFLNMPFYWSSSSARNCKCVSITVQLSRGKSSDLCELLDWFARYFSLFIVGCLFTQSWWQSFLFLTSSLCGCLYTSGLTRNIITWLPLYPYWSR